jgi:hypothetical protein
MSPGMMTSRNRGGFQTFFPRAAGHRSNSPTPSNRTYHSPHGRFAVAPNTDGGSNITLTEDETVSVGTDADGAVTITVNPKPAENGNGLGQRSIRRGLPGRSVDKMAVSTNSDGSVVIRPEGDAALQIVGDPLSGAVTVVEIEPEPLNTTPNGQ